MAIARGWAQASVLIATWLFTATCGAQPAPTVAAAASTAARTLSNLVLDKYPYANGSLGPDWCRTFEAASAPEWWEFNQTDGVADVEKGWRTLRVKRAVRLQSIYDSAETAAGSGGLAIMNFSSIMMGFEFLGDHLDPQPRTGVTSGANLGTSPQNCPDIMAAFIESMAFPYKITGVTRTTKVDDDDLPCASGGNYTSPAKPYLRVWRFGDRPHKIRCAARIEITLDPPSSGKAFFVVGYGGGSGP